MSERYIVRMYTGLPRNMQDDMNDWADRGYRPKEIKLDTYQNYVNAIIIYELEGEADVD